VASVVVWIQCFGFDLKEEATGRSIAERKSGASEIVLAPWEESMTQRGSVAMSDRGEMA
jgi:hypothetical protein